MSLATIQTAAYDLLQVSSPSAADNVTMLFALNQARLQAELLHDFELAKTVAYLTVTATTGSSLAGAQVSYSGTAPSGATVGVKKVRRIKVRDTTNSVWARGDFMSSDLYEGLLYRTDRQIPYDGITPLDINDGDSAVVSTKNIIYRDGGTLFTPGTSNVDVQLWAYKWLSAYATIGAADDFLVTYGEAYLLWSAVVFFNHKRGAFLPRNEGSIDPSSPEGMKQAAWEALILWDSYMTDPANQILDS